MKNKGKKNGNTNEHQKIQSIERILKNNFFVISLQIQFKCKLIKVKYQGSVLYL